MKKALEILGSMLGFTIPLSLAGLLIVMAGTVALSVSLVRKNPEIVGLLKGPEILKKEEEEFVASVGQKISLPSDEKPTVASVKDLDKLAGQAFFKDAKEDDKVLIYTNAKKVILYRPSEERVVEVGSINITSNDKKEGEVAGEEVIKVTTFTVAILNGTENDDSVKEFEEELKGLLPEAEVVSKDDAAKRDYEKTVVVVLGEEKKAEAEALAGKLGVEVVELPEGEAEPKDGEVLVILGKDRVSR